MIKRLLGALMALALVAAANQASAQQTIVTAVQTSCGPEIETFCSEVTPGDGRMLACFIAHEDKLSTECINTLYDAMHTLERFVETLSYVASQCRMDIDVLCATTPAGEGRIAKCLLDNKSALSKPCASAVDEVGLEVSDAK